jgi:hypothetical protein
MYKSSLAHHTLEETTLDNVKTNALILVVIRSFFMTEHANHVVMASELSLTKLPDSTLPVIELLQFAQETPSIQLMAFPVPHVNQDIKPTKVTEHAKETDQFALVIQFTHKMDSPANHANQDIKLTSVTQSVKETDQYVLEKQSIQLMAFHVPHANQDIKLT